MGTMPSDRRMRQRVFNGFDGGGGIADAVDAIPERSQGVAPPRRMARRSRVVAVLEQLQRHHVCFDFLVLAVGNDRPWGRTGAGRIFRNTGSKISENFSM